LAAVDSWLKRGANVDVPIDEGGGTMLMSAAYQGHRALVDLLLEHRADVHAQKPADGCTALLCAVQGAAMSELRALDSALGARHSPTDAAPADECSGSSSSSGGGGSSSSSGGGGGSSSSSSGGGSSSSSGGGGGGVSMDMYIIKRLLDEDADPNQLCRKGAAYAISPLLFATQLGATGVVEMLLSRRALPDLDNELVPKPLVVACASRHVAIARLLLQHHAQVELVNSTECLPECLPDDFSECMLIASIIRWSRLASVRRR
jgi:ankyrin repeat protein